MAFGLPPAKSLFGRLTVDREQFLRRAREASALTVQFLVPDTGVDGRHDVATPFQSTGARAVNNLAGKLLLTLFPQTEPFFRLALSPMLIRRITGVPDAIQAIEQGLVVVEKEITTELEVMKIRSTAFQVLRHLLVAGLCGVYEDPTRDHRLRLIPLCDLVCKRNSADRLKLFIWRQQTSLSELDPELQDSVLSAVQGKAVPNVSGEDQRFNLFTVMHLERDGQYRIWQEVEETVVGHSVAKVREELKPFDVPRLTPEGDYARGLVEEYIGDLVSLEGLTQSIVEGAAIAARILHLVNPNSLFGTRVDDLSSAPNGAYRAGSAEDVTSVQAGKIADLAFAKAMADELKLEVKRNFLDTESIRRDAERVTQEEIQQLAAALEESFGGTFSNLGDEVQTPIVVRTMTRLQNENRIPRFPGDAVRVKLITGIEALSRRRELSRVRGFLQDAFGFLGDNANQVLNRRANMDALASGYNLDGDQHLLPDEQVQQNSQNQILQSLTEQLGPSIVKELGPVVRQATGAQPAAQAG